MVKPTSKKRRRYFEHGLARTDRARSTLASLGSNVRALRKERAQTLTEFATELGISYNTIWHIEEGHNFPSFPVYLALCAAAGASKPPLT